MTTATVVCNFLADQFTQGKQYSTINGYRSAISSAINTITGVQIGNHPLINRLMKGIEKHRPSKAKYAKFWDTGLLMNYINSLPENNQLSLSQLNTKLVILLRLATIGRSADIERIIVSRIEVFEDKMVLHYLPKKQQRSYSQDMAVEVPRFTQPKLCPVATVQHYLQVTSVLRQPDSTLVISAKPPHQSLTSQRIAKLVLEAMTAVGVDTNMFKAGSLRGATASSMLDKGASVDEVMRLGQWSSYTVFDRFYNRSRKQLNVVERMTDSSNNA